MKSETKDIFKGMDQYPCIGEKAKTVVEQILKKGLKMR